MAWRHVRCARCGVPVPYTDDTRCRRRDIVCAVIPSPPRRPAASGSVPPHGAQTSRSMRERTIPDASLQRNERTPQRHAPPCPSPPTACASGRRERALRAPFGARRCHLVPSSRGPALCDAITAPGVASAPSAGTIPRGSSRCRRDPPAARGRDSRTLRWRWKTRHAGHSQCQVCSRCPRPLGSRHPPTTHGRNRWSRRHILTKGIRCTSNLR